MLNLSHPTIDIAITCSDFEASLDFYHNKLGLEIVLELEIPDALARGVGLAPTGFRQVRLQGRIRKGEESCVISNDYPLFL